VFIVSFKALLRFSFSEPMKTLRGQTYLKEKKKVVKIP